MSAPDLAACLEYAEKVGLRVITTKDRKHAGEYVDVYLVYRLGIKQGKSRSPKTLMRLLKKTAPVKRLEQQTPPPPTSPGPAPMRRTPASIKPWWED